MKEKILIPQKKIALRKNNQNEKVLELMNNQKQHMAQKNSLIQNYEYKKLKKRKDKYIHTLIINNH